MTVLRAARLASELSKELVSEAKIRRLLEKGVINGEKESGRWQVDESSLRSYFS